MRGCLLFNLLLLALLLPGVATAASAPQRMLIDVRSNHSDGAHGMEELIAMAKKRGIFALAFTEHDRTGIRFGLEPAMHLFGYTLERPSLYTTGLQAFFADLHRVRGKHPEMALLAGTESTPGYWWSGLPFVDLTLHGIDRHIIALGIEQPQQVRALPSFDLRYAHGPFAASMAVWCLLVFAVLGWLLIRRKRGMALLLGASFIAFLVTWLGRTGQDADAEFIRTAESMGLFTIWAHPGTLSGQRQGPMGVWLDTPPYSDRVFTDPTAMAFAAVYGDTDRNTEPGGAWDRYLMEYMQGLHPRPIWGVAAGDFHHQGMAGEYLGNFPMDVWAKDNSPTELLAALKRGRMVAWYMPKDRNLFLRALYLEDAQGRRWLPGDTIKGKGALTLFMELQELTPPSAAANRSFRCQIVVDGRIAGQPLLELGHPLRMPLKLPPGGHVIRLRINDGGVRMEANPFFVRVNS